MIGNNLHNFGLRVSSRQTEQFHNKHQNCLLAFPINLTVCVAVEKLVQSTRNCKNVYSRCWVSIGWRSQTENWSLPQSFLL